MQVVLDDGVAIDVTDASAVENLTDEGRQEVLKKMNSLQSQVRPVRVHCQRNV